MMKKITIKKKVVQPIPAPVQVQAPAAPVQVELDNAPRKIDLSLLDPVYNVLIHRGTKTKFIELSISDPDDGGKLISRTIERTVADAFKFYVTNYPNLYQKWGGSAGVFRLILCGAYTKSVTSKQISLMNCIQLTKLVL